MFQYAKCLKEEGNILFKSKQYRDAIKKYAKVMPFTKGLIK